MVSEWIDNAPETPAMGVGHGRDLRCTGDNRLRAHGRGILDNQQHSNRATAQ
jgi:hypothetical protein